MKQKTRRGKSSSARRRQNRPWHKRLLLHPLSIFILACVGVYIVGLTIHGSADSYTVSAVVPGVPPASPAVITSLSNGATVHATPMQVSGSCPANSYVKLMRNGYLSGVDVCSGGNFQIQTDLTEGANQLTAQDYNFTDQPGPTATAITVYYSATPPPNDQTPIEASNSPSPDNKPGFDDSGFGPLLLTSQYVYQSFEAGQKYHWGMTVQGGTPPYVVTVEWGDGTSSNLVFKTDPTFDIEHTYTNPGTYTVNANSIDAKGVKVVFQLVAVIKKSAGSTLIGGTGGTQAPIGKVSLAAIPTKIHQWLWVIWPTYAVVLLMAVSFWLGERQEYNLLFSRKHRAKTR